jgi:hypothetical protein
MKIPLEYIINDYIVEIREEVYKPHTMTIKKGTKTEPGLPVVATAQEGTFFVNISIVKISFISRQSSSRSFT